MNQTAGHIDKLALVGVGMIGGSLALALKQRQACAAIHGYDADEESLRQSVAAGVIDACHSDLAAAVKGAEIVVLALPIAATIEVLPRLAGLLGSDTIVTDVGSAKAAVVAAAQECLGDKLANFVPGHPVAGRERSGARASDADLFVEHTVILTPLPQTAAAAKERVSAMWRQTGARVTELPAQEHDEILAASSHLPHLLAYALVDCLAALQNRNEVFAYAAGGFADFSRIASSDPRMWRDICIANRAPLLRALTAFERHLRELKGAVSEADGERLFEIFRHAKQTRDENAPGRDSPRRP